MAPFLNESATSGAFSELAVDLVIFVVTTVEDDFMEVAFEFSEFSGLVPIKLLLRLILLLLIVRSLALMELLVKRFLELVVCRVFSLRVVSSEKWGELDADCDIDEEHEETLELEERLDDVLELK